MIDNKTNIHKTINFIINTLLLIAAYFFIYYQLVYDKDFKSDCFNIFYRILKKENLALFIIVIALMPANWIIESFKWQYLISKTEKLSFLDSLIGVFTGITTSLFTPNRIGDFIGKVFLLKKSNHWKAILISLLGSMSQMLITFVIGSCSWMIILFFVFKEAEFLSAYFGFLLITIIMIALIILFYFKVALITTNILKIIPDKWGRIKKYLSILSHFSIKELKVVLTLSLLRYFVFNLQLFLLFRIFFIDLSLLESLMISGCIFFILSFIPSITLAEIGIRGSVAIVVFSIFSEYLGYDFGMFKLESTAALNILWVINIIIPALIGSVFILKLKFFRRKIAAKSLKH